MGDPCLGVFLYKKDPNVAVHGRVIYLSSQCRKLFHMGNPGQGVLLYKKDPDVAGLGRIIYLSS